MAAMGVMVAMALAALTPLVAMAEWAVPVVMRLAVFQATAETVVMEVVLSGTMAQQLGAERGVMEVLQGVRQQLV